jgi:hypothetical protein
MQPIIRPAQESRKSKFAGWTRSSSADVQSKQFHMSWITPQRESTLDKKNSLALDPLVEVLTAFMSINSNFLDVQNFVRIFFLFNSKQKF